MATLILTTAIPALFPGLSGWGLFAAQLAATAVGTFIDSRLFAQQTHSEGPRLTEISLTNSSEGAAIKRLYGRSRIGGTLIWATNFKEVVTKEKVGGKGGGSSQTVTNYEYFISFAVAFCEGGPCTELGRVWMDGKLTDISKYNWRWYEGTDTQLPDSLIQQIEGSDKVPGFRGVAYMVFEELPLADFGNRIPQVTAEINHMVEVDDPDHMENVLRGISMIPSSGEFIYSTQIVRKDDGEGNSSPENAHYRSSVPDFVKSLEQMECALPEVKTVNLVIAWFGDDLRIGECEVKPKVEVKGKTTTPVSWSVDGLTRESADTVSTVTIDGVVRPVYGGTPSDLSVTQAIQYLKSKGYKICFYPFILMDIPSGNNLPNPYSNNAASTGQPAFPWRGRITCSPAPGYTGTVDKTSTAASQVNTFFTRTWGVRRMILHYANLCKDAGGVDYFCVGTEMVGTTLIRSSQDTFPAVSAYATLIDDVKAIVGGGCEVGYAADWSEYHSYRPGDGTGDVYFNMDPIWQKADFIGIDNYMPMSDWRDGILHLDYDPVNGPRKIYDRDYLASNIEGGEYYDWYYLNQSNRDSQIRTPITDGYGKPWVFRNKDVRNWWENYHFNRPGGVDSGDNKVPNPTGTGAVPGTGSLPTGWNQIDGAGLTRTIVGVGVEKGLPYVDIRFQGTITSGLSAVSIQFNTSASQLAASQGDWREASLYVSLAGGTKAGVFRARIELSERNASGSGLVFTQGPDAWATLDGTLRRTSFNRQATHADCVGYLFRFQMEITSGQSVDFTIRVASPQFVNTGNATSWIPKSKRVIFTEFGCPAIDKATNQPNVFYDPKSSESFFPHYSSGERDDVIQRLYIETFVRYWRDNGGSMVHHDDMWAWTWDARPYPQFPHLTDVWSDGENWLLGHWLNGRAGAITLGALIVEFMRSVGLENHVDVSELVGKNTIVPGYVIDNIMSPRDMLLPLFQAFMFDGYESEGKLKFSLRSDTIFEHVDFDNLVVEKSNPSGFSITRQQETELLAAARVDFIDSENAYQSASVPGSKQTGESVNVARIQFPLVLDQRYARSLADQIVHESWAAREYGDLMLPNSFMKYDPGDGLSFVISGRDFAVRITGVENGNYRKIEFSSHEPSIYGGMAFAGRPPVTEAPNAYGASVVEFLDIPLLTGAEPSPWAPRLAAYQNPFPPAVLVYIKDDETSAIDLINQVDQRSEMGRTLTDLDPDLPWVINPEATVRVQITNPTFQPLSNTENAVFSGANAIAVQNDDGNWEIIQYLNADLVSGTTYDLSGLIRGQLGTEADMVKISTGARVVFIDPTLLQPLGITMSQRELDLTYRYGPSVYEASHETYQEKTLSFRSVALMPYAPTELTCTRVDASGTLEITWKRRTRFGGDDWGTTEPPLNEEFEQYELEICEDDGSVVRTLVGLANPNYTYAPADQITDFGSIKDSVRIRVYQMSATVGRGHAADEIVSI